MQYVYFDCLKIFEFLFSWNMYKTAYTGDTKNFIKVWVYLMKIPFSEVIIIKHLFYSLMTIVISGFY
jgi:hypothetical protein